MHPRQLDFIPVDDAPLRRFRLMGDSAMAYARLLLPDLLPDVDRVLYCDADTLWFDDAAAFWSACEDAIRAAGSDRSVAAVATPDCRSSAEHDGGSYGTYFCSGLMMIDLGVWRKEHVAERCRDWLSEHPEAIFWDQSALNRVLAGRVPLVDKMWNRYVGEKGPCRMRHYAGFNPWCWGIRKNRLNRTKLAWFQELAKLKGTTTIREIIQARIGVETRCRCRMVGNSSFCLSALLTSLAL